MQMHIGAAIKDLREACGLTQKQLADASDIGRQHLLNIEAGTKQPSLDTLITICSVMNCELKIVLTKGKKA